MLRWATGVIAGGFVALWALASLSWPLGLDQGIFAWVGDTILRGGVPYRDAWEIKGPATHYLYALAQWLFGRDVWGLRILDLTLLSASACAAYGLAARMSPRMGERRAGVVAALLWVLLYATGGYWHAAQPDAWAAMAWLAAAWCVARDRPRARDWVAAGALCAFTALLKPPFGAFLGLLLLDRAVRSGLSAALAATPAALGGLLGVLALVTGGFAAAAALDDFVEVQLVFNPTLHPSAYRDLAAKQLLAVWLRWLGQPWAGAVFVSFLGGVVLAARRSRGDALLLAGWGLFAAVLVVAQNQYFPYHFWPLVAVLAVGAGSFAGGAASFDSGSARTAAAALVVGAVLAAAWQPFLQIRQATALLPWAPAGAAERYRDSFSMGSYGFGTMERIAERIRERTEPEDPILIWGFESGLYFLADRPASTRLGFLYPLIRGGGSDLEARYLREFRQSLVDTPPVYVVVFAQGVDEASLPEANQRALADLRELLERCYVADPSVVGERVRAHALEAAREGCGGLGRAPARSHP